MCDHRSKALPDEISSVVDQLGELTDKLTTRGWTGGTFGNLSIRLPASQCASTGYAIALLPARPILAGYDLLCSAAGVELGRIATDPDTTLCLFNLDYRGDTLVHLWGSREPTSELRSHLSAHEVLLSRRSPCAALLHVHVSGLPGKPPSSDVAGFFVPVLPAGLAKLARYTGRALQHYEALVWAGHGIFVASVGIRELIPVAEDLLRSIGAL
jgi:ribulose-5-phosphate 4-epimerase/fuculose-1-phosphate aldolase